MKKILLIEDDSDLFSLLKYNLEKEGFAMIGQQTGKGALDLCRQTRPDLILLDIMLPDSDGLDICKGIRRDPELAAVPVILMTAVRLALSSQMALRFRWIWSVEVASWISPWLSI